MASEKKDRIMVACVTFETAMIVDPVLRERPDRVHLIHFIKDPKDPSLSIYQEFYDEVCRQIRSSTDAEIVEHLAKVYDHQEMLRTVFGILLEEKGSDAMVNVSSGTAEYSAAATIAAMMIPGTVPFTVGTKNYTISDSKVRDMYYRDGKPVGLTERTFDPKPMGTYRIDVPDEELVRALRCVDGISRKSMPTRTLCVDELKEKGLWSFSPDGGKGKTDMKQKEKMYFGRHYLDRWIREGWVEKNGKVHRITPLGKSVTETFYTL